MSGLCSEHQDFKSDCQKCTISTPAELRPITRGEAEAIRFQQIETNRRLGEIESKLGGEKKKWRDEVDRRLSALEGSTLTKWKIYPSGTRISIDRKIAEEYMKSNGGMDYFLALIDEIRRALEAK